MHLFISYKSFGDTPHRHRPHGRRPNRTGKLICAKGDILEMRATLASMKIFQASASLRGFWQSCRERLREWYAHSTPMRPILLSFLSKRVCENDCSYPCRSSILFETQGKQEPASSKSNFPMDRGKRQDHVFAEYLGKWMLTRISGC
jgi:hypothetical protein